MSKYENYKIPFTKLLPLFYKSSYLPSYHWKKLGVFFLFFFFVFLIDGCLKLLVKFKKQKSPSIYKQYFEIKMVASQ